MVRVRSLQVAVRGAKSRQNGLGSSGSRLVPSGLKKCLNIALITIGRVFPVDVGSATKISYIPGKAQAIISFCIDRNENSHEASEFVVLCIYSDAYFIIASSTSANPVDAKDFQESESSVIIVRD